MNTQHTSQAARRLADPLGPYKHIYRQARTTADNVRGMQRQVKSVIKSLRAGPTPALPETVRQRALAIVDTHERFEFVAHTMQCNNAEIERRAAETTRIQAAWLVIFVLSIFAMTITSSMGFAGLLLTPLLAVQAASSAGAALIQATRRTVLRERDCITPRDMWYRNDLYTKWFMPWR